MIMVKKGPPKEKPDNLTNAPGDNTLSLVKGYVGRIEGLVTERNVLNTDIKDTYDEADNHGINKMALRMLISERAKKDKAKYKRLKELQALYEDKMDD